MAVIYYNALRHLNAGTITAKEKRLLLTAKVKRYNKVKNATVSG